MNSLMRVSHYKAVKHEDHVALYFDNRLALRCYGRVVFKADDAGWFRFPNMPQEGPFQDDDNAVAVNITEDVVVSYDRHAHSIDVAELETDHVLWCCFSKTFYDLRAAYFSQAD